jgi:MarR family transcriptional regulator, 2-MHQ and catechol-resistance regulon repressor
VTREVSAELVEEHGLTLNEYEVLLLLSQAAEHRMKRIDVATQVRLTPSGVTRMLDRLEKVGLVEKGKCESDARITYAVLTGAGMAKLRDYSRDHYAVVERVLTGRLDPAELDSLLELLRRFTDADESCEPGD